MIIRKVAPYLVLIGAVAIAASAYPQDDAAFVADNLKYSRAFYSYVHLVAIAKSPSSFAYDRYPADGPERIRCDAGTFARLHGQPWVKSEDWAETGTPVGREMVQQLDGLVGLINASLNVAPASVKLAGKSENDGRTEWLFEAQSAKEKGNPIRLRFAKPVYDTGDDVLLHGFNGAMRAGRDKSAKAVDLSFGYLVNVQGGYELSERAWENLNMPKAGTTPEPTSKPTDAKGFSERGKERWKRGFAAEAMIDFDRAIERDPKLGVAYYERGIARRFNHDLDGAIADLKRSIELEPGNADAYVERGIARRGKKDLDGAIADYSKAAELDPKGAEFAFYNRALAREAKKDADGALDDFSKAIEANPKNANAFNNRGELKRGKNDIDGAIADFNQAIQLNPKFAVAFKNRGKAKQAKGDQAGGAADLKQATELNPQLDLNE